MMLDILSKRENEMVLDLTKGYTVKEIADRNFISPYTVDTHLKKSKKKTGARTLAHLAAIYIKNSIVVLFISIQFLILAPRKTGVQQRFRKTIVVSRFKTTRARYQVTA